jgi:hypothetical protein
MKKIYLPLFLLILLFPGCSAMPGGKTMKEKLTFSKPRPVFVFPFWEPVIRQQNGEVQHGYAARVFLYDKSHKPIKAEGAMDVCCFEEKPGLFNNTPTKIVTFRPEDMELLYCESELGPSYTIWIPWDEKDSDAPQVSLLVKFRPVKGGDALMSQQATLDTPVKTLASGTNGRIRYDNPDKDIQVRQVSFMDGMSENRKLNPELDKKSWDRPVVERIVSKENGPSQMQTTTLTLSPTSRFSQGPVNTVTQDTGPNMAEVKRLLDLQQQPLPPVTNGIRPASYQDVQPGQTPMTQGMNSQAANPYYQMPVYQPPVPTGNPAPATVNPSVPQPGSPLYYPTNDSVRPLSHYEPSIPQVQGEQFVPRAGDPVLYASSR